MAFLDVNAFLAPLSDESPCGDDLEYDPAFGEMDRAAQEKPAQEMGDSTVPGEPADWRTVAKIGKELMGRTRDLRVAMRLAEAGIRTHGMPGLRDGLALVHGLLTEHWDSVHPQLDPDDGNDPTMRINTLTTLVDKEAFLDPLKHAVLVDLKGFGRFSLRDIEVASGAAAPADDGDGDGEEGGSSAPNMGVIDAAFLECDLEELQSTAVAVSEALDVAAQIDATLGNQVGAAQAPNLDALPAVLREIHTVLQDRLARRGAGDAGGTADAAAGGDAAGAGAAGGAAPPPPPPGTISTREDAILAIDKICDYFRTKEPSSPVPVLLQRAKRLISKDFMQLLQDLAPDGADQFQVFRGVDSEDD